MSKENLIGYLYQEISKQNTIYIGLIALMIAMFGFFQWRFSQAQLKQLKNSISSDLAEKYSLEKNEKRIDAIERELRENKEAEEFALEKRFEYLNNQIRNESNVAVLNELVQQITALIGDIKNDVYKHILPTEQSLLLLYKVADQIKGLLPGAKPVNKSRMLAIFWLLTGMTIDESGREVPVPDQKK